MTKETLKYLNREIYFQKAITAPEFGSKAILVNDEFQYVELWLRRKKETEALFFWRQAKHFFIATKQLPPISSPLTSYYCMLNATKALLKVKKIRFQPLHGITGEIVSSKRGLEAQICELKTKGVISELSKHLGETETQLKHSLYDIFANLPFIHRAFSLTYKNKTELFIGIKNPRYIRMDTNKIYWAAEVIGRDADRRILRFMPSKFQIDKGIEHDDESFTIRCKNRIKWYPKQGAHLRRKLKAIKDLQNYHKKLRNDIVPISSSQNLWYLKREIASQKKINRYCMTLIMMAMHRLSELARYEPKHLSKQLDGTENWLLTEFIEMAPAQFISAISCEITGFEFRLAGVRRE